jgi:hypothetical protein
MRTDVGRQIQLAKMATRNASPRIIVGLADLVGTSLDFGDELDALLKSGSCCGMRDARVLDLPPLPLSRRVN